MTFDKSLKIAWIVKYIFDDRKSKWKKLGDFYLSKWGISFSWEKQTLPNMTSKITSSENLSKFKRTLFLGTRRSSPNTTFGVLV